MFNVNLYRAVIHVDSDMLTALVEDDGEREERERTGKGGNWNIIEIGRIDRELVYKIRTSQDGRRRNSKKYIVGYI